MKTIGILGAAHGLGCTHLAISIASAIKQKGYKVIVIDRNSANDFYYMGVELEQITDNSQGDYFTYKGIDFYLYREKFMIAPINKGNWDYAVLDFGVEECDLFYQCDFPLLVGGAREWNRNREGFYRLCESIDENYGLSNIHFVFPFADSKATVAR